MHNYLVVYGINTQRANLSCFSETLIDENELDKFMNLIKLIEQNPYKTNWVWTTYLEKNQNTYINHKYIYDMYPMIDKNILDNFGKYLPEGITRIVSIKIYKGEKIKII